MMLSIENSTGVDKRIDWIDSAKGLGIILVVLGHTWGIPQWLGYVIYAFHMPLFFLLSGLTCKFEKQIDAGNYFRRLVKAYILPYFTLAGINLVLQSLWLLYLGELSLLTIAKYIAGILYCCANVSWMPNCSPIWFLPGIFFAKTFVFVAYRVANGKKPHITALVVMLALVALIADWIDFPRMPWNILSAMMGCIFLWGGYCLGCDLSFMKKGWNKITVIPSALSLVLTPWIIQNTPGMNENHYGNCLLFIISGFGYSFIFIQIAIIFRKMSYISSFLGRRTMIIMGFNYFARTFATECYYLIPIIRNYPIRPLVGFFMTMAVLSVVLFLYDCLSNYRNRRRVCNAI